MASGPKPVPKQALANISALADIERARSHENEKTVKQIAQKFLGHIYDRQTDRIEERAVESFQDKDIVVDQTESLYVATLDATTDTAIDRLNNHFGFNIAATVGSTPFKIQGGLDIDHTKIKSSDSSTAFCAVACMRMDHVGFQKLAKRLGLKLDSFHLGIIKSMTVFAGYRGVLEIVFKKEHAEKKTNVGVKGEGSTVSTVIGGGIRFTHENSSLTDRSIEQINIKEIRAIGGYRVPQMKIPPGNDFPKIQEMFESIREHFEIHYYSVIDRLTLVNPAHDLVPFREIVSSDSPQPLATSSENKFLKAPVQRDAAYYGRLAREMLSLYNESFEYRVGQTYQCLNLGLMLFAIEASFSNLLELASGSSAPCLLIGTDPSTIRLQGVRLLGGQARNRMVFYPDGNFSMGTVYHNIPKDVSLPNFLPNVFSSASNATMPSVCAYGNVLETHILTNQLRLSAAHLPVEYDICLGVATNFAISRFNPSKIVVCIPRDFFQSDPITLVRNAKALYGSLRRVIYSQRTCRESILFVIDDQQKNLTPSALKTEITSAFDALIAERTNRGGGGIFSWLWGAVKEYKEAIEEIEEALEGYAFIVNRLAMSSNLDDILKTHSFLPECLVISDGSDYTMRERYSAEKETLKNLGFHELDRDNITLNNSSAFEKVFNFALRCMRYIENKLANLESRSITSLELLKSYDRILILLRKREIEKINKSEVEEALGKAVGEEIKTYSTKRQNKESEIRENTKIIEARKAEIDTWEKDTTPTPLKLSPDRPITMRSFWRIPPFWKEYIFQTQYKFSKCEFSKTSGSFNCPEAEFQNTKKAVFTPKHWGYEDDLKANVQIWIEKREHPNTKKDIENHRAEIERLKTTNISLNEELKKINDAIHELAARNIERLEARLTEEKSAFSILMLELNEGRSKFAQYRQYHEILEKINEVYFDLKSSSYASALQQQTVGRSENPPRKSKTHTNYYGLSPILDSVVPGYRYLSENNSPMKDVSDQERRPVYLITPGNQHDRSFGTEYLGEPLFFEFDGCDYRGLEPSFGQKPQNIVKEIEQGISKKPLALERVDSQPTSKERVDLSKTTEASQDPLVQINPNLYLAASEEQRALISLQDLLDKVDGIESSSLLSPLKSQNLLLELTKIWSLFVNSGLDDFFLNLAHRIEGLSFQNKVSRPRIEGMRYFGTFNQFSSLKRDGTAWYSGASRSSCTVNALAFLWKALYLKSIEEWQTKTSANDPQNNIINEILDEGRDLFEKIHALRKKGVREVLSASAKSEGKSKAEALQWEIGGDALHVKEVPDSQLQAFFYLKSRNIRGKEETPPLKADPGGNTTITQFEELLRKWEQTTSGPFSAPLGVILQCNGYSHGVALLRHGRLTYYVVFDSHGSQELNGTPHAFVYVTTQLRQAAEFLGNLVKKQDLSLEQFSDEFSPEMKRELNKLAIYLFEPANFKKEEGRK